MVTTPAHLKIVTALAALAACGVTLIVAFTFRQEEPLPPTFVPPPIISEPPADPLALVPAEPAMTAYASDNVRRTWHDVPDDLIKYFPDDPQIGPRLRERLATFHISPQEAHEAAAAEQARRKERGLEIVRFGEKPVAVTDRCYVFAEFSWIGVSLRGFYVDGDSGAVTWRENPDDVILYRPDDSDIGPRLKQRLASFKVSPEEALKLALAEANRRERIGEESTAIAGTPTALAGRKYVFAPPPTEARVIPQVTLTGIYIDGDTGHAEWRKRPER